MLVTLRVEGDRRLGSAVTGRQGVASLSEKLQRVPASEAIPAGQEPVLQTPAGQLPPLEVEATGDGRLTPVGQSKRPLLIESL